MDAPPVPPIEASTAPASVAPARRRFSWRDFFIGVAVGVVTVMLGLGVLLVGAGILISRIAQSESASEMTRPGPEFPTGAQKPVYIGPADTQWTFKTLKGAPVTLSDYRGKVVFLNFWATWCGPCVEELPDIQKLHESVKDDAVAFVLVSDEKRETIDAFVKRKPIALPLFRSEGKIPALFVTNGIPTTFIIDPGGTVVFKYIGAANWDHANTRAFLRGLLVSKPPAPAGR